MLPVMTKSELLKRIADVGAPAKFAKEFTARTGFTLRDNTVRNWRNNKHVPKAMLALWNAHK